MCADVVVAPVAQLEVARRNFEEGLRTNECWVECGPPQHGLSSKNMALITSDYGVMCYLGVKWP